ncbi:MAG: DEAD/DEAH box helicase [Verrucomicrobiota bacterium]
MNPSIESWFERQGWTPFPFQRKAWAEYAAGRDCLIHAPTGTGKTLAAWLAAVSEGLDEGEASEDAPALRVLWITPLRALATDTEQTLQDSLEGVGLGWTVAKRTGDTSSAERARQKKRLPTALIITPESLSLLLTYADTRRKMKSLRCVVVDEWHELMGSKRGTQTELALCGQKLIKSKQ